MVEYASALQAYCSKNNFTFIDPNRLLNMILKHPVLRNHYLQDHIHPTFPHGCYLYSAAVWEASIISSCGNTTQRESPHSSSATSSEGN